MTALAGEIADGLNTHGFTTDAYVRDVTIPQLEAGLARAGRTRPDIEVSLPVMCAVVEGDDDARLAGMRSTIAFYGSTPAYRPVLDHHGWSALGEELHRLSRAGAWQQMGEIVDDDVLHTFAVIDDVDTVATGIAARYGGLVDRLQLGMPTSEPGGEALVAALLRTFAR